MFNSFIYSYICSKPSKDSLPEDARRDDAAITLRPTSAAMQPV